MITLGDFHCSGIGSRCSELKYKFNIVIQYLILDPRPFMTFIVSTSRPEQTFARQTRFLRPRSLKQITEWKVRFTGKRLIWLNCNNIVNSNCFTSILLCYCYVQPTVTCGDGVASKSAGLSITVHIKDKL